MASSSSTPIFTLPVAPFKTETHTGTGGSFVLTQPAPKVYLLTFTSPPDNRMTPPFIDAFILSLDIILAKLPPGVVITTSGIPKFYSNGLDYASAITSPSFWTLHLYPLWRKLLTYPFPLVSLINGHAFAGGLMTSLCHDYRIQSPQRGFLCLNELDFNAPLTPGMTSIFRIKLPMSTFRTLILEGQRFTASSSLETGIIDGVGGLNEALKFIDDLKLTGKVRKVGVGSYGTIKQEMYREIIRDLDVTLEAAEVDRFAEMKDRERRLVESKRLAGEWEKQGGKLNGSDVTNKEEDGEGKKKGLKGKL